VYNYQWLVWCRVCWLHQLTLSSAYEEHCWALKKWPRSWNHRQPNYNQQLFYFEEVPQKSGLSDSWNAIHKEEEAINTQSDSICTKLFIWICHPLHVNLYILSPCMLILRYQFYSLHLKMMTCWVIETLCKTPFIYFLP